MIRPTHNPLEHLHEHSRFEEKASIRYRVAVLSAVLFLGWLILELTLAF